MTWWLLLYRQTHVCRTSGNAQKVWHGCITDGTMTP